MFLKRRTRVLVVDDDASEREVICLWLANSGYEAVEAADGFEAIACMRDGGFDVVLTDQAMPGLSGLQLLTIVKELDAGVQVIFLSGQGTMRDAIEALHEGRAFDFLQKPLQDLRQLNVVIERALRHRHMVPGPRPAAVPAPSMPPHTEPLTPQELRLVQLLAQGLENRAIAERLHFSEKTVRNYLSRVYEKLGVHNRTQAVTFCQQYGLLEFASAAH